jgi:arylsulfatase A
MSQGKQGSRTTRREFLGRGLVTGAALMGICGSSRLGGILTGAFASTAADARVPNFIIIYCDDLGYGDVGCFGSPAISTPRIDLMAEQGVRFTDYYSCNAICAPSRAGLLTGRYPYRSGIYGNVYPEDEPFFNRLARNAGMYIFNGLSAIDLREEEVGPGIPEREMLLSEALKEKGYSTGMVGKWHLGDYSIDPRFNPVRNGFDSYFGVPHSNDLNPCPLFENERMLEENLWGKDQSKLTGLYTKHALQFIRQSHSRGKPFFLYFAHTFPHQPLWASEKFAGKSKGGKFGDAVEEIDWSVGRVLDTLSELGLEDNTLVIFTSDNGPWYEGSAAGLRGRKGQSMEGGFRVPMIARMPGHIPPGSVCSQPVMNIDFYPTLLGLAGMELPKDRIIDGKDIYGLLTGESDKSPHQALFFYHFNTLEGIRVGRWKYMRRVNRYVWPVPLDAHDLANSLAEHQLGKRWPLLYDLKVDPGESYNVIDRHPEVVKKLEAIMAEEERAKERNPGGWL